MKGHITREEFERVKAKLRPGTPVKILTGSMSPFIRVGQKILIKPFERSSLKRFDTLVFFEEKNERLICHFFYHLEEGKNGPIYHTRGLNSKLTDKPFSESEILGVVTSPHLPTWKRFFMKFLF